MAYNAPSNPKVKSNDHHFDTEHLKENLKERSVKGGAITMIAQVSKLALQIGSNVFLARLLTPSDFGLVAMVSVVATFIVMFKDMGLSQATVQKADINHEQISTLFWINVAFGLLVMLVTWALAPAIASFYNEPALESITFVLAVGLFIGGLTVQHQALLRRQMRFKELSIVEVGSMFSGVTAGIVTAWIGFGYWALVILQITQASVMLIGVWYFSKWRPGLPVRNSGIGSMLAFGGYMTAYGFINYFARNLDTILIGWRWGATQTGLYSRAYSLLLLPIGQLTAPFSGVAVPALSRLQNEPEQFKNYYLKTIKIIAYVSMPMIISMAILAHEIVFIVLGDQWAGAAELFQVLAIAAFWQPIASTVGWIYVSLGNVKRMMYWGLIGTSVMATAIAIGLPWGASGVALGYSISMWLLIYPLFSFAFYGTPIDVQSLLVTLKYPTVVGLSSGVGFYLAHQLVCEYNTAISFFGTLLGGFLSLGLITVLWQPLKEDMFGIFISIKNILKKKKV
jgi:PST family polysaccharide transporter